MAYTQRRTGDVASAAADAMAAMADGGLLRLYDGEQPVNADTSVTSQTLLAELALGDPAFEAAVDGVANALAIADEDSAPASGTATWFRVFAADGTTPLWDGSVGTSGSNLNVSDPAVVQGEPFSVSAFAVGETM